MTLYIAAYDTESPECLAACPSIVEAHRRWEMPATFFITGVTLDADPGAWRKLLDDELFEVASHGHAHKMLRDHVFCGPAASAEEIHDEIFRGRESVESVFERPCVGLRTACGWPDGMRSAPDVARLIREAGFDYLSSHLWGPDFTMPAPLTQPFQYETDGADGLWELPGHGWQENLLKDNNGWGPSRLTLWPPNTPEAIPQGFVATPEEEFEVNRWFLERAGEQELTFVSLIWHPWSLGRFDRDMKMLDLTFAHVRELGMTAGTYADLLSHLRGGSAAQT